MTTTRWPLVRLEEVVAEALPGFAVGERDPHGVVQLRMNNVDTQGHLNWSDYVRVPATSGMISKYRLLSGDVVFNNTNSTALVGKSARFAGYAEPVVYSNHFTRLRPVPDRLDSAYLAAWLLRLWQQHTFEDLCNRWIGQSAVNREKLLALEIPLPSVSVQRRIVAKLDEQMSALDRAEKALAGQQATASILATAVLQHALNEPESPHWPQVRLGDMMESDLQQVSPDDDSAAGLSYVGMEDIESQTGRIIAQSTQRVIRSNTFVFDEHHVLYGKLRPYLNKVALPESRGRCSTELIPLLPKAGTDRRYLAWLLRRPETVSAAMQEKTGSRMPRASMQSVMQLHVPLPPLSQQKQIARSLDQAHANLAVFSERVADQEASLVALRITLLDAAFSGEI